MSKMRICFSASSGGHLEQIEKLEKHFSEYEHFVITEKTKYNEKKKNYYYVRQVNRKEKFVFIKLFLIFIKSIYIYIKKRPNIVITTGVLATIPICIIAKFFGGKIIFIESYAKINSPTKTGLYMYKKADLFYVQWKELLKYYPNAKYIGGVY